MSKPKFEDLTNLQIADLIATKIMGYEIRDLDTNPNGEPYTAYFFDGAYQDGRILNPLYPHMVFNPINSWDDCWRAEEKFDTIEKWRYYAFHLGGVVGTMVTDHRPISHGGMSSLLHATATQKCEAMLRAIGEVE